MLFGCGSFDVSCSGSKISDMRFQVQSMALVSHMGPSYCSWTVAKRCKTGHSTLIRGMSAEASNQKTLGFFSSVGGTMKPQILHLDNAGAGCRRGQHVIVAASPPTEDAVVATEPLTKEDLVGYLASGCKPKEKWRLIVLLLVFFQFTNPEALVRCSILSLDKGTTKSTGGKLFRDENISIITRKK